MQYVQDSRIKGGRGRGGRAGMVGLAGLETAGVAGGTERGADDVMWRMGVEKQGFFAPVGNPLDSTFTKL